jgi:hypothetical protein
MGVHQTLTGAQRAAKRAQGLRLTQIWVPDLRDPKVLAKIERGIASINADKDEAGYNRWLDQNFDDLMADEPPCDLGGKLPG